MKILLLGAHGQLGRELQRALAPLGEVLAFERSRLDLADLGAVRACAQGARPEIIVNAAAYTAVDAAESDPDNAFLVNADAPRVLAEEAARSGAWLLHYSTDYVFDGEATRPYTEQDRPNPLSVYGRSKLAGEEGVRAACPRHLIVRTSWLYSRHGANFPKTMLRLAREREHLRVVADQFGTPTPAALVADISAHMLRQAGAGEEGERCAGTYHVATTGSTSWHLYARELLALARANGMRLKATEEQVEAVTSDEYGAPAARPRQACLDTTRLRATFGLVTPDWRAPLPDLIAELAQRNCP